MTLYLITQSKKSLSSLELMRHLGLSYNSAWLLQQKIIHALNQEDQQHKLEGIIHVDDGYLGVHRSGIRGRGATGKTPFTDYCCIIFSQKQTFPSQVVPCG